jgi:hypothetical protein
MNRDFSWPFWPVVPLYPYGQRRTIRQEVVKETIWTFDQLQGILYVVVPVRMTVVRLSQGGLLVYAPVAPTGECLRLVNELVTEYGDIKYIILPTISGIEHKVFVGPFARYFPRAQVFVAPDQWSFPLNLPLSWLGLPQKRTQLLPLDSAKTPFTDEFDYAVLGPINLGPGRFEEVAFFHKGSRTLLLTDSIVSVPENPLEISQIDPYPLLFHAKDRASDIISDTPTHRRKGWQRIALFTFYFRPRVLEIIEWPEAFREAKKADERSQRNYFGLFPFRWQNDWKESFDALRGDGRPFVAPVLQTLILNRAPRETIDWVDRIVKWDFQRIIPCHFDSPIEATPHQLRQAFVFLENPPSLVTGLWGKRSHLLPEADFEFLKEINEKLTKSGIVPPAKANI